MVAFLSVAALAACSSGSNFNQNVSSTPSGKTIEIGIDLPLSGRDASVGRSTLDGMVLAVDQANKKGLPGGYTLQVVRSDDAVRGVHSPQQGVANMKHDVSDPNVLVVLGPYNSNVAAAQIPVTNAAGLAQIAPSTVSDTLTLGPDAQAMRRANPSTNSFFRVCTTDSRQGAAAAMFALQRGFKKAYIIDDNEMYGLDLANVFEKEYQDGGGAVLGHNHTSKKTQDFKSLLTQIRGKQPDIIFYGGTTSTGGGLIREEMFDTGLGNVAFMGGDGIPDIGNVAGARADGTFYTLAAPNPEKMPSAHAFIRDYEAAYHSPVGPYSANGYAAAQVAIDSIARAIKANKNAMPTRALIVEQVAKTNNLATPIGTISFDQNGDVKEPVLSLYTIKDGKPEFIDEINL